MALGWFFKVGGPGTISLGKPLLTKLFTRDTCLLGAAPVSRTRACGTAEVMTERSEKTRVMEDGC